jgi:hypothetical protein
MNEVSNRRGSPGSVGGLHYGNVELISDMPFVRPHLRIPILAFVSPN